MKFLDSFLRFLESHTIEQWERFIVWSIMMVLVYYLILIENFEIKKGLRGKDLFWQSVEIITYLFIYMLPGIILSNVFLQYAIDEKGMQIIMAILLVALGIRGGIDAVKHFKGDRTKDKPEDKN